MISVVGLGKAGLPLAAVIAESGQKVIGVDLNENTVESVNNGICPLNDEPGLEDIIKKHGGKNLVATTDQIEAAKTADFHIIIVPLLLDEENKPDFSIMKSAISGVGRGMKKGDTIVLETTIPVGTTETMAKEILENESGLKCGEDFYLAFSPERTMTGYSLSRFKDFYKVVGGVDKKSTEKTAAVYEKFTNVTRVSNSKTAELTKIAEGMYRDVNIAFANELMKISEKYGVNVWEVIKSARHDFCNILEPGIGVGGHCIPVYPWFVINDMKVDLIKTARLLNDSMVEYHVRKILEKTKGNGKVGVVGLIFREGVKETTYSRSRELVKQLKESGLMVYGKDPMLSGKEIKDDFGIEEIKEFNDMDVVIVVNKNSEYKEELKKIKEKVIDCKNIIV